MYLCAGGSEFDRQLVHICERFQHGAHGVVVSHPLRMRKALGSNPSVSTFVSQEFRAAFSVACSMGAASIVHSSRITTGPVAQWIRHRPTEPGIAGSSPAGVILLYIRYPPLFLITMDTRLGVGHCIGSQSC